MIHQPCLFLQRTGDPIAPVPLSRAAAARIRHATLVELDGDQHLPWLGDTATILERLREFVGAPPPLARAERVLATILFTDIVASTERLSRLGDSAWGARLDRYGEIVERSLGRFDGRLVNNTGDGTVATFAGPARGVAAARGILEAVAARVMGEAEGDECSSRGQSAISPLARASSSSTAGTTP